MRPPLVVASTILSGRASVTGSALAFSVSSTPISARPWYVREATSYESPPPSSTKYGTRMRSTPAASTVIQRYGMAYVASVDCDAGGGGAGSGGPGCALGT